MSMNPVTARPRLDSHRVNRGFSTYWDETKTAQGGFSDIVL